MKFNEILRFKRVGEKNKPLLKSSKEEKEKRQLFKYNTFVKTSSIVVNIIKVLKECENTGGN